VNQRPAPDRLVPLPAQRRARRAFVQGGGAFALASILGSSVLLSAPARAAVIELLRLDVQRSELGVTLDADVRFELPPGVEDALQKGVALYFVAEVDVYRSRWYWMDQRVSRTVRTWRLSYQPLTFTYRLSFGGLSQSYRTLGEALRVIQRAPRWRIADPLPDDDSRYYAEYLFKLDTNQLPRPLLIGVSGQNEWSLQVERTVPLTLPPVAR
jgi:Domain of unknown function (DUF4390)